MNSVKRYFRVALLVLVFLYFLMIISLLLGSIIGASFLVLENAFAGLWDDAGIFLAIVGMSGLTLFFLVEDFIK